jgi:predicted N-acyltransferase
MIQKATKTRRLVGIVPVYIKGNSYGEFIFDQSFVNAAYQMRMQ